MRLPMTRGAAVSAVVLFAFAAASGAANLLWTAAEVGGLRAAVSGSCEFERDIGTIPVTPPPPVRRPSRVGVAIVADARLAYQRLGCAPPLPPPAASFVRWARYYDLPSR
ncbi:MAG TPA: hypothetical protein VM782_18155 [Stellaceae bacterium]|nr:hypothetical protein [Stellaceae bacterium]